MRDRVIRLLIITLGNALLAFSIAVFSVENQFLLGGVTGIANSVEHYLHASMTSVVAVINLALFLLGWLLLGRQVALTTIVNTLLFPMFLDAFLSVEALHGLTGDLLLAALVGGALNGLGIGIVLRQGGSTGGIDILALILNRKLHFPVAVCMYCFDIAILLSQTFFSSIQGIIYGIVVICLTSVIMNYVLSYGAGNVQALIISKEFMAINEMIQNQMDRGSTFFAIQTGHEKMMMQAVLCVLSNRDLHTLNQQVNRIDQNAFIVISSIREVRGEGFTPDKHLQ